MSLYEKVLRPALFRVDAEQVHEIGVKALSVGLGSEFARRLAAKRYAVKGFGELKRFGLNFKNPIGIAAGFDKNAMLFPQLESLGFGFVEVGTVTLEPQPGNPKPRLFRLPKDRALINRLGFNNAGSDELVRRLSGLKRDAVLGINIGKNKEVPIEDSTANYLAVFERIKMHADYVAVNVSSPNTPNLRKLQDEKELDELLGELQKVNSGAEKTVPLLLKVSPDLSPEAIESVAEVCTRHAVSGIIATNTTISREGLETDNAVVRNIGDGGVSGKPVGKVANDVISRLYRGTKGQIPIIGVGGVFDAVDAFAKIASGASLVQAYTGFVYKGPAFARSINQGLLSILEKQGFEHLDEAIGSAVK